MSVPSWLTNPQPSAVPEPPGPPPIEEKNWAAKKIAMLLGLIPQIRAAVVEPGDAADQSVEKCESWLKALRDHPVHGRNWWAKYGDELRTMVQPYLPKEASEPPSPPARDPDEELEGTDLLAAFGSVWPEGMQAGEMDRYYGKKPFRYRSTAPPTAADVPSRARPPEWPGRGCP